MRMSTCSQIKKSILLTYYHTLFQQSCDSSPSKHIFAVTYKWFLRKRLGKHVGQLIFCRCGHNRNLISLHSFMEEMVGLVDMLGSRSDFEQPGNSKAPLLSSKTLHFKTLLLDLLEESHKWNYLP